MANTCLVSRIKNRAAGSDDAITVSSFFFIMAFSAKGFAFCPAAAYKRRQGK